MSKSRIWNVTEDPATDESNRFTRISFDNEQAAHDFIEAVHKLEYESYLSERSAWDKVSDGWKMHKSGAYMTRTVMGREMRSYKPPKAVSYERWLVDDVTLVPDDYGNRVRHIYDQMHEPTKLAVELDWLYGDVPELVADGAVVRTRDELDRLATMFREIDAPST